MYLSYHKHWSRLTSKFIKNFAIWNSLINFLKMGFINWLCLLLCIKLCFALQDSDSIRLKQMEEAIADILDKLDQKESRIKLLENTVSALEEKVESQNEVIRILREQKQHIVKDDVLSEMEDNSTAGEKSTVHSKSCR